MTRLKTKAIKTIGHSTLSMEEFIGALRAHSVELLVDVRTIPRSRHNPQFNIETLPEKLRRAGIGYVHMKGLGGLRKAQKDSINTGWRNASFRGFADYMQTDEFEESLEELIKMSEEKDIAIMCAEALPWRCHRSLIADALTVRKKKVEHVIGRSSRPHGLTAFARAEGKRLTYPAPEGAEA